MVKKHCAPNIYTHMFSFITPQLFLTARGRQGSRVSGSTTQQKNDYNQASNCRRLEEYNKNADCDLLQHNKHTAYIFSHYGKRRKMFPQYFHWHVQFLLLNPPPRMWKPKPLAQPFELFPSGHVPRWVTIPIPAVQPSWAFELIRNQNLRNCHLEILMRFGVWMIFLCQYFRVGDSRLSPRSASGSKPFSVLPES